MFEKDITFSKVGMAPQLIIILLVLLVSIIGTFAICYGETRIAEPTWLIDVPTAGILYTGVTDFNLHSYYGDGLLFSMSLGVRPRFMVGIAMSAQNVIGYNKPETNPPSFIIRYRLIHEGESYPAVSVGFSGQGYGEFYKKDDNGKAVDRYLYKSKGFYMVASSNYGIWDGNLGIHVGANYSLETRDGGNSVSLFAGTDISFRKDLSFLIEYDTALNDQKKDEIISNDPTKAKVPQFGEGEKGGIMNAGVRWYFTPLLSMEERSRGFGYLQFNFRNLTRSSYLPTGDPKVKPLNEVGRELRIVYVTDLIGRVGLRDRSRD